MPATPLRLTEDQKQDFCLIVSVGCDRETACKYLSCTPAQLYQELKQDNQFAAKLLQGEAASELNHMRNLHNAAKDEKHWRASVWWLERRSPDRFGRRAAGAISQDTLRKVIEQFAEVVVTEISTVKDRQKVLKKLAEIAYTIEPYEPNLSSPDEDSDLL